jgi:hypothetical protein
VGFLGLRGQQGSVSYDWRLIWIWQAGSEAQFLTYALTAAFSFIIIITEGSVGLRLTVRDKIQLIER